MTASRYPSVVSSPLSPKIPAGRAAIVAAIAALAWPALGHAQSAGATAAPAMAASAASPGSTLPAVRISAGAASPVFAGGQVARGGDFGVLGQQKSLDVPFSMTSYTEKLIEDQQARTLADVLANDPSVRTAYGYGNFSEVFVIRGFQLDGDDVSLNGLYGLTPRQLVSTDALARVDVFKGANAFLNGASPAGSAIGGGINLQLKRADDAPLTSVTVEGTGSGGIGEHVDVGRRFGSEGQFGIRVNQANHDGETSVDGEHRRDDTTAVSLDWRGEKLRLYGDFLYQKQQVDDGRPVVYVTGDEVPAVPSATYNYAQTWSDSTLEDTVGILRAEYDFLPGWTAYVTGGARHTNERGEYASPSVGDDGVTTASRLGVPRDDDANSAEAGVRGHFMTGPVSHFVTAGASIVDIDAHYAYTLSGTYATSLYDTAQLPYPGTIYSGGNLANPGTSSLTLMRSVAASDTLGFLGDRVLFTAGLRHQSIVADNYDYTGAQTEAYNDAITTPVFGLVVKPWRNVSFFANRSEALAAGAQAPSTALNAGALLPPERSKQYEMGVKYDDGRIGASLAAFQIEEPFTFTNSSGYFVADGNERHRGLETSVYGEPWRGVRVIAGATYLDARQLDTDSGTDGNRPIGVPSFMFNLGAEYDVPLLQGLTLNARWVHTGPQYLDAANTLSIPAWDRFDVGARYATVVFGKQTTFRASVLNVTNKAYWASAIGGYLTQGAPRTLLMSVTTDF
ncbi:TonB-dependent siderophore receptor [Burkholderia sp. WAC0059]|uniref:TonB-dependent receptor n=1 Tax=Burkholderia sp. WAC0059 TaxID=2066022 RepID=UPI000C7E8922|nr:TonB-dependent siderophore receptor [Burkholderia sp. WAC0059]PLZ02650.1 TonB-dependent siderophore receptor [Burkholderia sp. WAC0059]